jgi:hypothetical protein
MLLTARAERGPQWDIGTQQWVFSQKHVITHYEPGPLLQIPS